MRCQLHASAEKRLVRIPFASLFILGEVIRQYLLLGSSAPISATIGLFLLTILLFPPWRLPAVLAPRRYVRKHLAWLSDEIRRRCRGTYSNAAILEAMEVLTKAIDDGRVIIFFWGFELSSSITYCCRECKQVQIRICATQISIPLRFLLLHEAVHLVHCIHIRNKTERDLFLEEMEGKLSAEEGAEIERQVRRLANPDGLFTGPIAKLSAVLEELLRSLLK